jgi:hypothetical protein
MSADMKDYTISIKREFREAGLNIAEELLKVSPDAVVLGGDPAYAIDASVSAWDMGKVRAALGAKCDIEDSVPFKYDI